ncbi:MAG: hypothetical protein P8104_09335, partial [Gammaproteobacteria bacterium]
ISLNALALRKRNRKLIPVPSEHRLHNEDEHTRISPNALALRMFKRKLVPVPPEARRRNEDEHTRISLSALIQRDRARRTVPVPPENRLYNEDEHTQISLCALNNRKRRRKLVPIPPEHRLRNEDEHSLINPSALAERKRRKLKSAAPFGEKPYAPSQVGETSVANALADSNSARQNSPILTRSATGWNASPLQETTALDTMLGAMETDEALPPFESDTAFSHWLDDLNVQQNAIDYIQNCHW